MYLYIYVKSSSNKYANNRIVQSSDTSYDRSMHTRPDRNSIAVSITVKMAAVLAFYNRHWLGVGLLHNSKPIIRCYNDVTTN